MNKQQGVDFIFSISKEVKHFYETPVVFLTNKDYSDEVFNILCSMRTALVESAEKDTILDIIVEYHLQWLRTINELENYQKRLKDVTREEVYKSISYTIDAICNRFKYFNKYFENLKCTMTPEEARMLEVDLELVEEMNKEVTYVLLEKLTCFRNFTGEAEFHYKLKSTCDELMDWIDKLYDQLSIVFAKSLKIELQLANDLTKSLKQIVEDLSASSTPEAQAVLDELKLRGQEISAMLRSSAGRNLEITKIVEKINALDDRIKRLESQNSSAVVALVNKKKFLQDKLSELETLKTTLQEIHFEENPVTEDHDECICSYEARIFNHLLPVAERERLVTDLCYLWDKVIFGAKSRKSIISILSATDMKEEFTDELGTFYVDTYGRKIYKKEDDPILYQQNEKNKLVALHDDVDRVYYYDECGRYFIDKITRQRVYKAHAVASEYMMDSTGLLLKVKEERDGIVYFFDSYGRYYVNDEGRHIYREPDTNSEYEHDGFGNLVRLRTHFDLFALCPDDTNVSEDATYLKETVGKALRESIAAIALYQPADPIKDLSLRLKRYRSNIQLRDKRAKEKEELLIEREIRAAEERAAAERARLEALRDGVSEASFDSNLFNYATLDVDDTTSATTPATNN